MSFAPVEHFLLSRFESLPHASVLDIRPIWMLAKLMGKSSGIGTIGNEFASFRKWFISYSADCKWC